MVKILPKKKLLFWRLTFIFSGFTILALLILWAYNPDNNSSPSMMSGSMGQMMRMMHGQKITINDLIYQEEMTEQVTGMTAPRHGSNQPHLQIGHYLTTLVIVFLMPFILAGSLFLLIIWFK